MQYSKCFNRSTYSIIVIKYLLSTRHFFRDCVYKRNKTLHCPLEKRKIKWSRSIVSNSLQPHGLCSPWNSPGQNTGERSQFPSSGDLPNPGIKPRSPALQADSLPPEPPGKPPPPQGHKELLNHGKQQIWFTNCLVRWVLLSQTVVMEELWFTE